MLKVDYMVMQNQSNDITRIIIRGCSEKGNTGIASQAAQSWFSRQEISRSKKIGLHQELPNIKEHCPSGIVKPLTTYV